MTDDLRLIKGFGDHLEPPEGQPPADLRRRALAGALAGAPKVPTRGRAEAAWFSTGRRLRRAPLVAAAAASVAFGLVVSLSAGTPQRSVAPTPIQLLQRAADSATLTSDPTPQPGQFVFIESLAMYGTIHMGRWRMDSAERVLVREWLPIDGTGDARRQYRPYGQPDAPWRDEPSAGCGGGFARVVDPPTALFRCAFEPIGELPTDADAMHAYLYRASEPTTDWRQRADVHQLAFERAALALYLGRTTPAVQTAVFDALRRVPGVSAVDRTTDVAKRPGVALVHQSAESTTELIFDAGSYRYLGMNYSLRRVPVSEREQDFRIRVLIGQAVQRAALVDSVGALP